jgi:hypothetical protein
VARSAFEVGSLYRLWVGIFDQVSIIQTAGTPWWLGSASSRQLHLEGCCTANWIQRCICGHCPPEHASRRKTLEAALAAGFLTLLPTEGWTWSQIAELRGSGSRQASAADLGCLMEVAPSPVDRLSPARPPAAVAPLA